MLLSIVIPALNEADALRCCLDSTRPARDAEVIVVDGQSADGTAARARSWGAMVLESRPRRAVQMNEGARQARGDVLLFLHGDTRLPQGFERRIDDALSVEDVVAGAFELGIDAPGAALRVVEKLANWRSRRLRMPYGDQALFVRSRVFHACGGFRDIPVMEDFDLVLRLRAQGRVVILPVQVKTSARRWQEYGVLRTTLVNQIAIAAYLAGMSPDRIARLIGSRRAGRRSPGGASRSPGRQSAGRETGERT